MDLFNLKPPGVRIFADIEPDSSSSSYQQSAQPSSSSSLKTSNPLSRYRPYPSSSSKPAYEKSGLRKASNHELQLSSPQRSRTGTGTLRSSKANQLPPLNLIKQPAKTPLRRHQTAPVILREHIKQETGVTPKTPQRHENPFEPVDIASVMARPWLDTAFLEDRVHSPEGFRWSIDHMATLNPVNISHQDVLRTELLKHVHTESDEENCQVNIRRFFDEDSFHPPTPSTKSHPHSDAGNSDLEEDSRPDFSPKCKPYVLERVPSFGMRDAVCQTDVHISPKFNFEKYFATFQIYGSRALQEPMGNVRRRLFTDIDEENSNPGAVFLNPPLTSPAQQMDQSLGFEVGHHSSMDLSFEN